MLSFKSHMDVTHGAGAACLPPRSPVFVATMMFVSLLLHVGFFAAFSGLTRSRPAVGTDARAQAITIALVAAPKPAPREAAKVVSVEKRTPARKPELKTRARSQVAMAAPVAAPQPAMAAKSQGVAVQSSLASETRAQGLASYGRLVWKKIAESKPVGLHRRGQVDVQFTVTPSGGVSQIVILDVQGGRVLEGLARDTLARAVPFPTPPAGLSAAELTFAIALRFK
ncbi:MAG: TonB family protein [Rhizobiales bacterium]|nr:TonB family protein [Hyphomicrobiales bacterium]